jgi:hypothetical protein
MMDDGRCVDEAQRKSGKERRAETAAGVRLAAAVRRQLRFFQLAHACARHNSVRSGTPKLPTPQRSRKPSAAPLVSHLAPSLVNHSHTATYIRPRATLAPRRRVGSQILAQPEAL